ncbi:hypothetical protein T459_16651 [Capsicum annuum]|uniref:Uncharacterized protein n=1 Tax=Capsicum annuum TaxID=4072 RepID=A0A2G2Z9F6_CAPAN|nr:hypothetical protein FXO37_07778 [Capsicum annuum]PHT78599.1 hypothetical protein T459_16651 [Capsicum annuum]
MPRYKDEAPVVCIYTVCDESKYLIVRNVPALGCADQLSQLFSTYGQIQECALSIPVFGVTVIVNLKSFGLFLSCAFFTVSETSVVCVYLSLSRFDEVVFSYQKSPTIFKSSKGDNHPSVAFVFVRLADLYYKTGKLRESRSYCENALRIYAKPGPRTTTEETACGLTEISVIYELFNEPEEALKLLLKAIKLLEDKPG